MSANLGYFAFFLGDVGQFQVISAEFEMCLDLALAMCRANSFTSDNLRCWVPAKILLVWKWALPARIVAKIGASGAAFDREARLGWGSTNLRQNPSCERPCPAEIPQDLRSGLRAGGPAPPCGTL